MIEFDEKTHTYTFDKKIVPSVTQIINAILVEKFDYPEGSAARGSKVHAITAKIDLHNPEFEITKEVEGYIKAYTKFLSDFKPTWEHVERKIFNPEFNYAGTVDRIGRFNGMPVILDIKTGIVTPTTGCQLAAYREAYAPRKVMHRRYALHLKSEGTYKLIQYAGPMDWRIFQAALTIFRWRQNNGNT